MKTGNRLMIIISLILVATLLCGALSFALADEWVQEGDYWWYRFDDGTYPKDEWLELEKIWYHFDEDGFMETGWQEIKGAWYYFLESGEMVTGAQEIGGFWYYFDESGAWVPDGLGEVSADGAFGDNMKWTLSEGTLTISGKGEMENFASADDVPWAAEKNNIKTLVVKNGVTTIGSYAFDGCTQLKSAQLPAGITVIGKRAFAGCGSLSTMTETPDTPDPQEDDDPDKPDQPSDGVPGDVSGDGIVNTTDLIMLLRFVNGQAVTLSRTGDVSGDGAVNTTDLILLLRYVNGQAVELH